jgi:hypothetical protein
MEGSSPDSDQGLGGAASPTGSISSSSGHGRGEGPRDGLYDTSLDEAAARYHTSMLPEREKYHLSTHLS